MCKKIGVFLFAMQCVFVVPQVTAELLVLTFEEGNLYRVQLADASPVLIGATGFSPAALDYSSSGVLFAIDPTADVLLTIDDTTGAATVVGPLGVDVDPFFSDLTFGGDGELLMSSGWAIYSVDIDTGAATFLVDADPGLGGSGWFGLAYANGILYGDIGWLHTIDLTTGVAIPGAIVSGNFGMDIDESGRLWGITQSCPAWEWCFNFLSVTDPTSGQAIDHWSIGIDRTFKGMAVATVQAQAIPAVNTMGAFAFGFGIACCAFWMIRSRR